MVIEDAHWADEAAIDVIRMIARRIETVPVLLALSWSDDELAVAHPLQSVLGELSRAGRVLARLSLPGCPNLASPCSPSRPA